MNVRLREGKGLSNVNQQISGGVNEDSGSVSLAFHFLVLPRERDPRYKVSASPNDQRMGKTCRQSFQYRAIHPPPERNLLPRRSPFRNFMKYSISILKALRIPTVKSFA